MSQFLDRDWTLNVPVGDVIANLQKENADLKEKLVLTEQHAQWMAP